MLTIPQNIVMDLNNVMLLPMILLDVTKPYALPQIRPNPKPIENITAMWEIPIHDLGASTLHLP